MKPDKSLHDHAITIENLSFFGILLLIIAKYFPHPVLSLLVLLAGLGLLFFAAFYNKMNYICPHCGHMLPMKRRGCPNFCPECGHKLSQEQVAKDP